MKIKFELSNILEEIRITKNYLYEMPRLYIIIDEKKSPEQFMIFIFK